MRSVILRERRMEVIQHYLLALTTVRMTEFSINK